MKTLYLSLCKLGLLCGVVDLFWLGLYKANMDHVILGAVMAFGNLILLEIVEAKSK